MLPQDTDTALQVAEDVNEEITNEIDLRLELDRFLGRVIKNQNQSDCWHFLTADKSKPSVDFYIGKLRMKAKRFAFEVFKNEKVPANLIVVSKCNNQKCVNPDHHVAGDYKEVRKLIRSRVGPPKKGWKQKPEAIEAIRKAHLGKKMSEELKEKIRQSHLGTKHSEETKKKMSLKKIGRTIPEEVRRKISMTKATKNKKPNQKVTPNSQQK
jgi:hypothetical protein